MIISIAVFSSIFSYVEIVKNNVKRHKNEFTNSPLIFVLILFCLWEIINLFTLDFFASYNLMFIFYVITYASIIGFFSGLNIKFWIKNWSYWKEFFYNLPFLFICLFDIIFFLFYYHSNLHQSDLWYWYAMMTKLHNIGHNLFSLSILQNYSSYLTVGIYQFGTSLDIFERFFLFPYFQTFIFFFFLIISAHVVVDKYLWKNKIKLNFLFITICFIIIFFYLFYNYGNEWAVIEGDWVSVAYILILPLIYFLQIDKIKNKFSFILIPFSLLFINESCSSLLPLMLIVLVIVFIIFRKKYSFNLSFEILILSLFFYSVYITLTITFSYFSSDFTVNQYLYYGVSILLYVWLLLVFLWYGIKHLLIIKINYSNNNFIIRWWYRNSSKTVTKENWFYNRNIWLKTCVLLITNFLLIVSTFNILEVENWNKINLVVSLIFLFLFIISNSIIITRKKENIFFYFFYGYLLIIFILHLCLLRTNVSTFFVRRLLYSGLMINGDYMQSIKNVILLLFMWLLAIDWYKKYQLKIKCLNPKIRKNIFYFSSIGIISLSACVPAPICQAIFYSESIPTLSTPNSIFHLGFSKDTINRFNKINFNNKLTFSDFYLPAINSTAKFTQSWGIYNPFNQIDSIYQSLLNEAYYDSLGNKLTNYNLDRYKNNILPNYDYVVLQYPDTKFINLVFEMSSQFKLELNINNQIYIFKNIKLDLNKQEAFMQYNNFI